MEKPKLESEANSKMREFIKGERKPDLAEHFLIEFGGMDQSQRVMREFGFSYRGSSTEGDDVRVYRGERSNGDGTTIEIRVRKGDKYKTPKELADIEAEAENKRKES